MRPKFLPRFKQAELQRYFEGLAVLFDERVINKARSTYKCSDKDITSAPQRNYGFQRFRIHNLVVCTLCSCYPWPVLGLPPVWYKSFAYRSRAVSDPRGVLEDFGLELPSEVEIRVWDSSAEIRYLVIPQRPKGTARMTEDELAAIVTRDSMVGVAKVEAPRT